MAYTPATKLPSLSDITFVQLSRPDAQNPRLASAISSTATTIVMENPVLDSDGAAITEAILLGIRDQYSYVETVYVPAGGVSGSTLTGCVRGIRLDGLDWTTGDTDLAVSHKAGDAVFVNISGVIGALYTAAINGTIATGGTGFTMGTEGGAGSEIITIYRTTTAGNKLGFLRWNTTGKTQYSNDGGAWTNIEDVSASNLTNVSAADTTPGYLDTKITVDADTMTKTITSPAGDERLELAAVGGLADMIDDVTATADEINQALAGISVNVTDTNLNTLTAGSSSSGDALHTHSGLPLVSATAGETLVAGDTFYIQGVETTTVEADADAYIEEANPTTNYNTTDLEVRADNVAGAKKRALLHFDISGQPATVERAYIRLYVTSNSAVAGATRKLELSVLNGSFDETTVTWNLQPGITATTSACSYDVRHAYPAGAAISFDVTSIYNSTWSGTNNGLSLRWDDESTGGGSWQISLGSRTNGTAGRRPDLVLIYEGDNYGRAYKTSSAVNSAGMKGIVRTGGAVGETISGQVDGVNLDVSGLTAYSLYKAGNSGVLTAATNSLDAQAQAYSATSVKLLDKRKEYASDILSTANTIYDLDYSTAFVPAGIIVDNQANTAASASVTLSTKGYVLGIPDDNGVTSRSVGMATVDIL